MLRIDPDDAHVFGVLMAAVGATIYLAAFSFYRKYRQFVDTVTSAARSVAAGFVRVEGHAMGEHTLVSPMFQTPCLYFALRIIGVLDETRNPLTYSKGVKFYLQDETGKVLVDPTALRSDSVPLLGSNQVSLMGWKSSGPSSFAKSQAEASAESHSQPIHIQTFVADFVASYLAAHPMSVTARMALLGGGEVHLEERVIAPYQHYVIQGTCVDNPYARDPADVRMISKGPGNTPFEIVDETEVTLRWEKARRTRVCLWSGATILGSGLVMFIFAAYEWVTVLAWLVIMGTVIAALKAAGVPVKFG
jgi:hypothetical protein